MNIRSSVQLYKRAMGILGFLVLAMAGPSLAVTIVPETRTHGVGMEAGSISVLAPGNQGWTVTENLDWVSVVSGASGTGNGMVVYLVSANTGPARIGTLAVDDKVFTISQEGAVPSGIVLEPTSRAHGPMAEAGVIQVGAPTGTPWQVTQAPPWVHVVSGASGVGDGIIVYVLDANTSNTARTGIVVVVDHPFVMTQSALPPGTLALSPTSRVHRAGVEQGSIQVTAPETFPWTASEGLDWVVLTGGASGVGSGTVTYAVSANPTSNDRSGTILVAGLPFQVAQKGATGADLTLAPTSALHGANAEAGWISISAPSGYLWSATKNVDWVTFTSGDHGVGSGLLSYTVAQNDSFSSRSGVISILGRLFPISQQGQTVVRAPSNVAATDGAFGDKVRVTWSAPSGALDYEVWRSSARDSNTAVRVGTNLVATTFDDTGAVPGRTYYYWVRARGPTGLGPLGGPDTGFAVAAVPSPNDIIRTRRAGSIPSLAEVYGVVVRGSFAYTASGAMGLAIYDLGNPRAPRLLGQLDTPGLAVGIQIVGQRAYLADGNQGLQIVDVSDALRPRLLGHCDTPSMASVVSVVGPIACVADGNGGLRIIDVSVPAMPAEIGFFNTPAPAWDVCLAGTIAYVAAGPAGLLVLDITVPSAPVLLAEVDTPGRAMQVQVEGSLAYVADDTAGLQIYDVGDPSQPVRLGGLAAMEQAKGLHVVGALAAVTDTTRGLVLVDVSDPWSPVEVGSHDLGEGEGRIAMDVFLAGNMAYVADGNRGLQIIRLMTNLHMALNDYDGDGVSDLTLYEAATGNWYIRSVLYLEPIAFAANWGFGGCEPVPGDYDGDGVADLAVFHAKSGNWYIRTLTGQVLAFAVNWGFPGCIPVWGDYDGDGIFDLAVYHKSTGRWYIRSLATGEILVFGQQWGTYNMDPVPGDYDGDGIFDLAVFEWPTGKWYIRPVHSMTPFVFQQTWGNSRTLPVSGDFNGDGRFDLAVYDWRVGNWSIRSAGPGAVYVERFNWGAAGHWPEPGDYNGDGAWDIAVYRSWVAKENWLITSIFPVPPIPSKQNWGTLSLTPVGCRY